MIMKSIFLFLLISGMARGCGGYPPPDPVSAADCKRACDHFRLLDCSEGKPTAGGVTCEEVCGSMPANREYLNCAATIEDCPLLEVCPRP